MCKKMKYSKVKVKQEKNLVKKEKNKKREWNGMEVKGM